MAEVYPRLKRYRKICKLVLRFHSSVTVVDHVYVIEINRREIRVHEYSSRVFRFEHGIEKYQFSPVWIESRSRFWERRVWRSLNILAYNKKKREEASRVGGKVAYLIVRRKVHTRIQKVR